MTDWIEIKSTKDLPNFITHGFPTGKKIEVRHLDGSEEVTIYQGFGLFGNGLSMFDPCTHWRPLGEGRCQKCGSEMQPGKAIAQTFSGSPDFIGGDVCTLSPGGQGKLIECSKCTECGWSVTV